MILNIPSLLYLCCICELVVIKCIVRIVMTRFSIRHIHTQKVIYLHMHISYYGTHLFTYEVVTR